jgi:pyrimidine operon attenuation protein/uracil phosphoribosyltransferase
MSGNGTRQVMDAEAIHKALVRVAHEILERNKKARDLALVGIRSRGEHLAQRIRTAIHEIDGRPPLPCGVVDITLYRDDLDRGLQSPVVKGTEIPFPIDGRCIVLVDDVIFTGRTVRAAMDALVDFGRPQAIRLAVLVDRGHREVPIKPDHVGKNVPTAPGQQVAVRLAEVDGADEVLIEG